MLILNKYSGIIEPEHKITVTLIVKTGSAVCDYYRLFQSLSSKIILKIYK